MKHNAFFRKLLKIRESRAKLSSVSVSNGQFLRNSTSHLKIKREKFKTVLCTKKSRCHYSCQSRSHFEAYIFNLLFWVKIIKK